MSPHSKERPSRAVTRVDVSRPRPPQQGPVTIFTSSSMSSDQNHYPQEARKRQFLRNKHSKFSLGHTAPSTYNKPDPFATLQFLSMPTDSPPPYSSSSSSLPTQPTTWRKSNSSPLLQSEQSSIPYAPPRFMTTRIPPQSDADDQDDHELIYTIRARSGLTRNIQSAGFGLRSRIFGTSLSPRAEDGPKVICTTPGAPCAGETETETDEPVSHLPTSRIIPPSGPLIPPNNLQQLTPFLFEFSRLLSIVPAVFGTLYNIYHLYYPPGPRSDGRRPPERIDFAISAVWAVLTGYQCLCLTTGLLTRWRLYYPPLSTLIRLFALQGICWPATQLTCTILEHQKRPVVVWAVIGTTTCVSRGVQIWVTSNLWWETRNAASAAAAAATVMRDGEESGGYWKRWGGGKWGGRRWDWREVGVKCVLPAGLVYFVMAWAEQLRREFSGG